jgi:adenine-specific DNA-methyltransferase
VGNSLLSKFGDEIINIDWNIDQTAYGIFGHDLAKQQRVLLRKISQEQKEFFSPDSDKKKLSADIRNLKIDLLINQLELMVKTQGQETEPKAVNFKDKKKFVKITELYYETIGWKNTITQLKKLKTKPELPLNFFDWKLDFPDVMNEQVMKNVGFDIVIGNPPYFNIQKILNKKLLLEYKKFKSYRGKADILYFFIERANSLLRFKGILYFITASYFTKSHYADKIRQFIVDEYEVNKIIDFGSEKVFQTAHVDTCILELTKKITEKKENFLYSLLFNIKSLEINLEDISIRQLQSNSDYRIGQLLLNGLGKDSWSFQQHTNKNSSETLKLGDICFIGKGVATGKDQIFIVNQEIINDYQIENHLLESLIESSSIDQYYYKKSPSFLIRTTKGINISLYPNTLKYLTKYRNQLEGRYAVQSEGLKWYEIVRYNDDLFNQDISEQIFCYYRSTYNKFAYSSERLVSLTTSFVLTKKQISNINMKYITAILNSNFIKKYSIKNAKKMGQCFEYSSNFLASIPIKKISSKYEVQFIRLVDNIILYKTQSKDTTTLEQQIDNMVYKLYQLTYEEVKIIDPEITLTEQEYADIKLE